MVLTKTQIFHITLFEHGKSIYIQYLSCNFNCVGCIRRLSLWDTHIPQKVREVLRKFYRYPESLRLDLNQLEKIISFAKDVYGIEHAVLGGGEPTYDETLAEQLKIMKK